MNQQDDFDRGLVNRRAVLGDEWVDASLGRANALTADFQSFITRYAWHEVWGRPGLDVLTRRLLVLGMTMGLARWEEFELHLRAAIRADVPLAAIQETLLQGAIYCGVPAANTAFKIASALLVAEGKAPAPQPLDAARRVASHRTFSEPQLRVCVQGQGSPLMLSHALGLDLTMWDGLAASLSGHHRVARYDHRGHGGSACPAGPYALQDLVDDAARLIREWACGPVVWLGLSLGGMVGMGLAIQHPELLRGLVLANTTARYPEAARGLWQERIATVKAGGMAAVANLVVERYLTSECRAARPELAQALRAQLLCCDSAAYAASCAAVAEVDWLDQLDRVRTPTLVIAGALDGGATPAMAQAIAERIPGATLAVLDGASHLSVAEQPEAFEAAVTGFLAGLSRS